MIESVNILAEKKCAFVTFIDAHAAAQFVTDTRYRPIKIHGNNIKIAASKPTKINQNIMAAVQSGATRAIYVGNVEPHIDENILFNEFSQFGAIDQIKIVRDKKIAFIHMGSISDAVKAIATLQQHPLWIHRNINFGKDRCTLPYISNPVSISPIVTTGKGPDVYSSNDGTNRTLYLGNLPEGVTSFDLANVFQTNPGCSWRKS